MSAFHPLLNEAYEIERLRDLQRRQQKQRREVTPSLVALPRPKRPTPLLRVQKAARRFAARATSPIHSFVQNSD